MLACGCWRIIFPIYSAIAKFLNCSKGPQKQGVSFSRDLIFKFNQKPYVNAGTFFDYIRAIPLQYIDIRRGLAVLAQEIAGLFMDDCSAHVNTDVIPILTEARVRIIIFAPHTSQVFQVLDLTLFRVLKRCPKYELTFDDDNAMVKVITKVSHDFTKTIALEFDVKRERNEPLFDEIKLRESPGLQELWSLDFPLDQLSGRRQIARFVWINKPQEINLTSVRFCFAHHGPGYYPLSENAKMAYCVILRTDSDDLHGFRFFHQNELQSLFYS
jgi:hypothetical protein